MRVSQSPFSSGPDNKIVNLVCTLRLLFEVAPPSFHLDTSTECVCHKVTWHIYYIIFILPLKLCHWLSNSNIFYVIYVYLCNDLVVIHI